MANECVNPRRKRHCSCTERVNCNTYMPTGLGDYVPNHEPLAHGRINPMALGLNKVKSIRVLYTSCLIENFTARIVVTLLQTEHHGLASHTRSVFFSSVSDESGVMCFPNEDPSSARLGGVIAALSFAERPAFHFRFSLSFFTFT